MAIKVLLRNTISVVLCGMILMGQVAAWIHVVSCQDHHRSAQSASESGYELHRCCLHQHSDQHSGCDSRPTQDQASDGRSQTPSDSHDSDHCVICQSLATAGGVLHVAAEPLVAAVIPDRSMFGDSPTVDSFTIAFPHLRGPPQC